jgi:arylsulfatase A-like enzyme
MRLILFLFALCPSLFATQPNFLLVMADDMGFSDLGCYGSEIETPNLDKLAAGGLRFSQFYNTAKCHSSRVSLLSGRWCRQAGDESLQRAVILPEVLAPAGYFTAMTGKWHLSKQPTDFGFQRYFGHLSGATNYFTGDKTFRLNGQPFTVPETGFYTTIANVDHALKFIAEARAAKKPWFHYIAFNAPHAPLQPLEQDFKKYQGRYDIGWDAIRAARVAKQKQIGLLPADSAESPRPDHIPEWTKLSAGQRSDESRMMSAYAGLIDRIDQEMGRLIADLEKAGDLDNTVILFVSDNGACPFHRGGATPNTEPYLATTRWGDSTGWAWARNSPFRFYKQNQFEGGISTPAILHWPAGLKQKPGSVISSPAHLVDVLPTFAELAGAKVPTTYPDRAQPARRRLPRPHHRRRPNRRPSAHSPALFHRPRPARWRMEARQLSKRPLGALPHAHRPRRAPRRRRTAPRHRPAHGQAVARHDRERPHRQRQRSPARRHRSHPETQPRLVPLRRHRPHQNQEQSQRQKEARPSRRSLPAPAKTRNSPSPAPSSSSTAPAPTPASPSSASPSKHPAPTPSNSASKATPPAPPNSTGPPTPKPSSPKASTSTSK